jgi:endonuclease/exonuclease/phosphatase family metal-dependent hydrolase
MDYDRVVVMTLNMDEGTDFKEISGLQTPDQFPAAVTAIYHNILATKPDERAAAMARVIAEKHPDLVALHEASMLRTGPLNAPHPPSASKVEMNLISSLLRELEKLGAPYDLMYISGPAQSVIESTRTNLDAEAPSTCGFNVRITDRDAIIARTDNDDIQLTALEVHDFSDVQTITNPVVSIIIPGGWIQLDATIRGRPFRFVSVHLDPGPSTDIQWLQAKELLTNTSYGTDLPIVFGGDFNAPPVNVPENTHYKVYQELTEEFTDAWKKHDDPGFTCCQDDTLRNPDSNLIYRIDLVLYRAGADWDFDVENIEVVGDKQADKTLSGLWPSDHAGVVATLAFTPRRAPTG